MNTRLLIIVLLLGSCYQDDNVDRDVECSTMPAKCDYDGKYDTCAEVDFDKDPCGWYLCVYTVGMRGEWVERRRCLRDSCGIPFDETCFAQYRVLMKDCIHNDCSDEFEASHCVGYDEEARYVCG